MSETASLNSYAKFPMPLCGLHPFRSIFLKDTDLFTENVHIFPQNTGICLYFRTVTDFRSLTENLLTSYIQLKTVFHSLNIYNNISLYLYLYIIAVVVPAGSECLFFKINSVIFNMLYYSNIFLKTSLSCLISNQ